MRQNTLALDLKAFRYCFVFQTKKCFALMLFLIRFACSWYYEILKKLHINRIKEADFLINAIYIQIKWNRSVFSFFVWLNDFCVLFFVYTNRTISIEANWKGVRIFKSRGMGRKGKFFNKKSKKYMKIAIKKRNGTKNASN